MEQAQSEDEGTMASIIDEIFDNANRPADADESNTVIDMTFNSGGDFVVNGINQGRGADDGDNGGLGDGNIDEHEINLDNDDDEELEANDDERNTERINGGTKAKVNCHLVNVNELCFINIIAKGCKMLEKANPFVTRFRKGKRTEQMGKFYKEVHDECTSENGNDLIQNAFNRLRNRVD